MTEDEDFDPVVPRSLKARDALKGLNITHICHRIGLRYSDSEAEIWDMYMAVRDATIYPLITSEDYVGPNAFRLRGVIDDELGRFPR